MKPSKLDREEQELLSSYERGEWQSIPTVKDEIQKYRAYAAATMKKNRLVSIDLSPEDFEEIQQKAQEQGIPYHALIAKIVHEFVAGHLVEQS